MTSPKQSGAPCSNLPLDDNLALQLWALSDAFERRLRSELAPLGLTVAGFRLVGELIRAPEGLRLGTLAKRLGLRAPTVCAMVDRFEARGLLERVADPTDGRASRVRLAADAPLARGIGVLEHIERGLLDGLNDEARAAMAAHIAQLTARLTLEPEER